MNIFIFILSTLLIISTHIFALALFPEEKEIIIVKPQYQKISMQFAQVIPAKKAIVKKEIKKEIIKEEVFIKPIKKDAKRKLQKKKKAVAKKSQQKVSKKTPKKKVVAKKIIKAPIKKVKDVAPQDLAQSLKVYKIFKQNYITKLRSAIDKNKKYPRISRKLKEHGVVTISFRILKSGKFINIKIFKRAIKQRLNKAALNAVVLTEAFEKFPKKLSHKEFLDIELPIKFTLH
jgi:protein TonB